MNQREKDGSAALLRLLDKNEAVALSKTVTNNQISVTTKDEAIRAIVTYSVSSIELLKRRRLKRDLLFQYLVKENVAVDPRAGKPKLAHTVLSHWGRTNVDMLDLMEIGDGVPGRSLPPPDIQQSTNPGARAIDQSPPHQQQVPTLYHTSITVVQNNITPMPQIPQLQQVPQFQQAPQLQQAPPYPSSIPPQLGEATPSAITHPDVSQDSWLADFLNFEKDVQKSPQDTEMGLEFCKWFYKMLNGCNPRGQPSDTPLETSHFFPDAALKVLIVNTNELQAFDGSNAACQKLLSLARDDQFIFNVNLDSGISTMATPHGLKMLIACGTLHKGSDMVGVFAQQFGLVRNPEQNFNWNIKYSNLKLVSGQTSQLPTIQSPGTILPIQ